MHAETVNYNNAQSGLEKDICHRLARLIDGHMPEADNKIWHRHPVWFLDENPIVGYSKLKAGIRLMFWSGASFDESDLKPGSGKFKDASALYTHPDQIDPDAIERWMLKAKAIQWDYKNIVKRKGRLVRLR